MTRISPSPSARPAKRAAGSVRLSRLRHALPALVVLIGAPLGIVGTIGVTGGPVSADARACTGVLAGITVSSGNDQLAKVGTAFATPLQAAVVDTDGCPVAGADVEFEAPTTGASATFSGDASAATVATGTNGIAVAPTLTANELDGSYDVVATVSSFSVDFQLTNTTAGVASSVVAVVGNGQSATVGDSFGEPLQVLVSDAYADPVAGATVDFDVVTAAGAGATFAGGGATAVVQAGMTGIAVSPALTAGTTAGPFTVTATLSGTTLVTTFSLTNLAGSPSAIAAGVGTSQSTELGTDFAVPLAVTVTDADGNDVPGAAVTFKAPASGASGVFAGSGASASVLTNADGIATAPGFSANERTGGYVVTASVAGVATPATFAFVNEPRTTASAPGPAGSYWLVTGTGRVLRSGSAPNYGSPVAKKLGSPVVAMAAVADDRGYWVVTSKGVVYGFGDVTTYGSATGLHLSKPIVGIAATPDGKGYWLVASDGGVFAYGDAVSHGSAAGLHLSKPIVGIAATPDGKGYWLVTSNGRTLAYGDATFYGSGEGLCPQPVKAIVATPTGAGYWIVSANGTAAGFGDAGAQGSPVTSANVVVGGAA